MFGVRAGAVETHGLVRGLLARAPARRALPSACAAGLRSRAAARRPGADETAVTHSWKNASFSQSFCRSSCWRSTSRTSRQSRCRDRTTAASAGGDGRCQARRRPPAATGPAAAPGRGRAGRSARADRSDRARHRRRNRHRARVFTTAGAALKSWRLKDYLDGAGTAARARAGRGAGVRGRSRSRPTTPTLSTTLASAVYQPSAEGLSLGNGARHADVPVSAMRPACAREDASTSSPTASVRRQRRSHGRRQRRRKPVTIHGGPGHRPRLQPGRCDTLRRAPCRSATAGSSG